ncbi:MAG: hypothetical protein AB1393_03300, partial [Candidatus Edwardsbacteria bacterium]
TARYLTTEARKGNEKLDFILCFLNSVFPWSALVGLKFRYGKITQISHGKFILALTYRRGECNLSF